jgi:zinc protease
VIARLLAGLALLLVVAGRAEAVEIKEVTSPGGIRAWLVEQHSIPLIAMAWEFEGGTSVDPEGKEGLAYLVSGLLNEGAGEMDALAFQKALDERAIRMGFAAQRDQFSGTLKTLAEEKDEAFRLLGLALSAPRFDADAVARVREQVYSVQRDEEDNPRSVASRTWLRAAFPDHPYGRNPTGTRDSVAALSAEDLRAYVKGHFARDRLTVGVVGDVTPEELGPLLDRAFGALPATGAARAGADATPALAAPPVIVERDVPQSVAMFGLPGLKRTDPDWYAALVMNHVLGSGGFSSRLMEEVRRKRGLTYGVYTYLLPLDHAGLLLGSVATVNERMGESKQVIEAEIARMAEGGVTEAELADAKTYLTGSYALGFDTSDAIAGQLVGIQRYGLGRDHIDRRNGYIEAVTGEDVARVARRLLAPAPPFWVIVGRPEGLAAAKEASAP